MHELSLADSMIRQLEDVVKKENATKVERIDLILGAMSGVEREPFEFVFPIVSKGTVCEDAKLYFTEVPITVLCSSCNQKTKPEYPMIVCENCKSTNVIIVEGKDFTIKSMEVS